MLYDIRITLHTDYDMPVVGGRHIVRILPRSLPGIQQLIAGTVTVDPPVSERIDTVDFFLNNMSFFAFSNAHERLEVSMTARIDMIRDETPMDVSTQLFDLAGEIDAVKSLDPDTPHHFLGPSPRIPAETAISDYARETLFAGGPVRALVGNLCRRIHADFTYSPEATTVDTTPAEAFALKSGVCQDLAHVMIAGLRGNGIPAGYVSGYLRTTPPPGKPRLEGADAMHAWVRAWCGASAGWVEFDPTNAIEADNDHIVAGFGRDYSDVTPIAGTMRASGGQTAGQAVDVIPVG